MILPGTDSVFLTVVGNTQKTMVIADVYYNHTFQKFLRDGGYGCDKYAWGVDFMKMVADAFSCHEGGKSRLKLSDTKTITIRAPDLSWAKGITQSLSISYVADDGVVYYHAIELMNVLNSADKLSPIFRKFAQTLMAYDGEIPRADDMDKNVENIFSDGIERVVAERMARSIDTISTLEKNIEDMNAAMVASSKRFSETISAMVIDNTNTISRLETTIKRLREDNAMLEKRLIGATRMYRDKLRLSGWYVYEISADRLSVDLKLRGGSLTSSDIEHITGADVFYVTNDEDTRYNDDYTTISSTAGIDHLSLEDRVTFVSVPIRRNTMVDGVIIQISETSFIMTHVPKMIAKSCKIDPPSTR